MISKEAWYREAGMEENFYRIEQQVLREEDGHEPPDLVAQYLSLAHRLDRNPKAHPAVLYIHLSVLEKVGRPEVLSEYWWVSRHLGGKYWPRLPWAVVSQSDPEDFPEVPWYETYTLYGERDPRVGPEGGWVFRDSGALLDGHPVRGGPWDVMSTMRLDHLVGKLKTEGYEVAGDGTFERQRIPHELPFSRNDLGWAGDGRPTRESRVITVRIRTEQDRMLGKWVEE